MRKAITPVISVILLIMLVVAITGGAWYWMTNVQGSLQESAGSSIEETSELSSTQFSIVSAICNGTLDQINATILNVGSNAIEAGTSYLMTVKSIEGATLATDLFANTTSGGTIDTTTPELSADSAITIIGNFTPTAPNSYDLVAGTTYSISVNIGSSSQSSTVTCG